MILLQDWRYLATAPSGSQSATGFTPTLAARQFFTLNHFWVFLLLFLLTALDFPAVAFDNTSAGASLSVSIVHLTAAALCFSLLVFIEM